MKSSQQISLYPASITSSDNSNSEVGEYHGLDEVDNVDGEIKIIHGDDKVSDQDDGDGDEQADNGDDG